MTLSLMQIIPFLLAAARWTLLLASIAFIGGGIGATLLLLWRYGAPRVGMRITSIYIQLLQARRCCYSFSWCSLACRCWA